MIGTLGPLLAERRGHNGHEGDTTITKKNTFEMRCELCVFFVKSS